MIPLSDGDSTPLGQRPLCVLLVENRLWASVRLGHIQAWFHSWVPDTVFSAGNRVSSVDAWYATTLDIEEILSGACDGHAHIFVADVFKSFDTVDGDILVCAPGRFGLPQWFLKTYFSCHASVRLQFKLAAGLGEAWTRDGGILQGCPLSMVFSVALYVPWCSMLIISNVLLVKIELCLMQPALLIGTLERLAKRLLLVSVCFLVPPSPPVSV